MDAARPLQAHISAFVHATEDKAKVSEAVKSLIPASLQEGFSPQTRRLGGHFGNPIRIIEAEVSGEDRVIRFLEGVARRLGAEEKRALALDFHRHVGANGSLYLRFDKQEAFLGDLKLESSDPIHVRVKFSLEPTAAKGVVESLRRVCDQVGLTR